MAQPHEAFMELKSYKIWFDRHKKLTFALGQTTDARTYERINKLLKMVNKTYEMKCEQASKGKWCLHHDKQCPCEDCKY